MQQRKIHYHYAGRHVELQMLCRVPPRVPVSYRPGHTPQRSRDPAQVTCQRCLRRLAQRTHEAKPRGQIHYNTTGRDDALRILCRPQGTAGTPTPDTSYYRRHLRYTSVPGEVTCQNCRGLLA